MAKRKNKPATAGERLHMRMCNSDIIDLRNCQQSRREARMIDRAIARAVAEERARVLAHAEKLRANLSGCTTPVAEGWRQCIASFESVVTP